MGSGVPGTDPNEKPSAGGETTPEASYAEQEYQRIKKAYGFMVANKVRLAIYASHPDHREEWTA